MIEKVFRDPVHTYIHVDHQVIYDLINTKEFQRLRRIKQLGTSGYTFHGGEHSRFRIVWGPMKSLDGLPKSSMRNIFKPGTITSLFW